MMTLRSSFLRSSFLRSSLAPRLLAGVGLAALLGTAALVSMRPAHSVGGPVPVAVTNAPLLTTPTDLAGPSQPFQRLFQPQAPNGARVSQSIVVPAHKRLVIEYVSASLSQYPSGVGGFVYLETRAGGQSVTYYLTDTVQSFAKRSQSLRLYADPGTTVTVAAASGNFVTPGVGADVEMSGYYVDVP